MATRTSGTVLPMTQQRIHLLEGRNVTDRYIHTCREQIFQKVSMLDVAEMAVRRAAGTTSVVENCAVSLGLACLGTMEYQSAHDPCLGHPAIAAA